MQILTCKELFSLEQYANERDAFRQKVMQHKKNRMVRIGEHLSLHFEDRLTMQYQIQEMLRIERIFGAREINEELQTYNALIPDGSNLKATLMIEYPDVVQRHKMLRKLLGLEKQIWIQIGADDLDKIYPIANEDLDRETENKTSAVHFLRFQFTPEQIQSVKDGAKLHMGSNHPQYPYRCSPIPQHVRDSLARDLS